MKKYEYIIRIDVEQNKESSFSYRYFDKQEEAKICFNMLSLFSASSEIKITVNKELFNEKDTRVGGKEIGKLLLGNEDSNKRDIQDYIEKIDWDQEVGLYIYGERMAKLSK